MVILEQEYPREDLCDSQSFLFSFGGEYAFHQNAKALLECWDERMKHMAIDLLGRHYCGEKQAVVHIDTFAITEPTTGTNMLAEFPQMEL